MNQGRILVASSILGCFSHQTIFTWADWGLLSCELKKFKVAVMAESMWKGRRDGKVAHWNRRTKRDQLFSYGRSETNLKRMKSDEAWAGWILISLCPSPCLSHLVCYIEISWLPRGQTCFSKLLNQASCLLFPSAFSTHLYLAMQETKQITSPCLSNAKGKCSKNGGRY